MADELCGTLGGLQGNVAGEAVSDDDIRRPRTDAVTLDKAEEFDRQLRGAQDVRSLLDGFDAFDLFLADIQERHRRAVDAEERASEGLAHDGEIDELARI